jgi:hypothetical protein
MSDNNCHWWELPMHVRTASTYAVCLFAARRFGEPVRFEQIRTWCSIFNKREYWGARSRNTWTLLASKLAHDTLALPLAYGWTRCCVGLGWHDQLLPIGFEEYHVPVPKVE